MSEKIIVLHPENQPEVDIYPIIKEGSIPNSVIDNQKIKSRTIINSNIALNTLKYEVLHQTLKDLIDSKITQANMENYLSSYYYNVEETQQYVGSEINTLHQTIQNEFYSNTAIDNMLIEKTDLSLFRQYLPSNYLNLTKQEDNQTSNLNLYATGSIFLNNFGNKNNSSNYYLPNSLTKVEDAERGYYVLSTTNDDYQSLYNLGAYDKITTNDDGTYTITRQTGYVDLGSFDWGVTNLNAYDGQVTQMYINLLNNSTEATSFVSNILIPDGTFNSALYHAIISSNKLFFNIPLQTSTDSAIAYTLNLGIQIQYKLATSYTEKVEANHYARYNQDFILEHNKSEAERSANLFDDNGTNSIQYIGHFYTNDSAYNYVLSAHDNYNCFRIRVEQNKTYYIKEINGLILRFEDINNNLVGGLSLLNTGYGSFTTPNGCKYVVFSKQINLATNVTMLNEGSEPLPYQPYEGKTIHEKDLGNYTNIYNVSQLYKHDYNLEAQPSGDIIHVTCWSTKSDKILLKDITRYAFSNVQVYNSTNDETIQVIKWASSGFKYINDSGNIDGMGYTVAHYYINGEPTTY